MGNFVFRNEVKKVLLSFAIIMIGIFFADKAQAATYSLKGNDSADGSSMNGAGGSSKCGGWTDGTYSAVSGKDYLIDNGYKLRSPRREDGYGNYTFAGNSLTFADGAIGVKQSDNSTLTIPRIIVTGSGMISHYTDCFSFTLAGNDIEIRENAVMLFASGHKAGVVNDVRNVIVTAPIRGAGKIQVRGNGDSMMTGDAYVRFDGDLSAFTGRIEVYNLANSSQTASFTQTADHWMGNPATLDTMSVVITNGSVFSVKESVTCGATRGFYFGDGAVARGKISVAGGRTVTIQGPVSGANGFEKLGGGRLVLGNTNGFDTSKITVTAGVVELPGGMELYPAGYSATVKTRLVQELIREKGGRNAVLAAAATIPALPNSGRWADLDYSVDMMSNWPSHTHVLRCEALAAAIAAGADESTAYADTIRRAMRSWYDSVPQTTSWWYNLIGVPQAVGRTAVLAESVLKNDAVWPQMIANLAIQTDHPYAQTGMNLLWARGIRFMYGLLSYNLSEMADDAAVMATTIKVVEFGTEGIQTDWSFHQHETQAQTGNYGQQFLAGHVLWANVFAGETYDYSSAKREILTNLITNGFEWAIWKGALEPGSMGRQIDDSAYDKGGVITNAIIGYGRALGEPVGYRYYDKSAYTYFRSTNWMASVKMGTTSIISVESLNGDNIHGWFLGDGSAWTLVRGDEYERVHALWDDWRMVPGVTQMRGATLPVFTSQNRYRRPTATVSSDNATRTTTFTYGPEEGLSYRKTWTFRDNGYDVKVTNVTVTAQAPARTDVATCIENANACAEAGLVYQSAKYSVYHNGEVYYIVFARPDQISFTLENRSGDMHDYVTSLPVGSTVSGRIFQLVVSHGASPSNGGVDYSVRIGGWDQEEFEPVPRKISLASETRLPNGQRELTLNFSTPKSAAAQALIVAYGTADCGNDLASWDTVELIKNPVLPEETSLVWMVPASLGKYARFFFVTPDLSSLARYRVYDSVKGDGTAYIDTGLKFSNGDWADLVFKYEAYDSGHNSNALFGYRVKSGEMCEVNIAGGHLWMQYWDGASTQIKVLCEQSDNAATFRPGYWFTAHLGPDKRTLIRSDNVKCVGTMDGEKMTSQYAETPYAGGDFETKRNMYLFAVSGDDVSGYDNGNKPPAKNFPIRSLKVYDGQDQLTRDYVAVKRISDGVFGMYDRVEGKFYGNVAGSGAFTGIDPQDEYVGIDLTQAVAVGESLLYKSKRGLTVIWE